MRAKTGRLLVTALLAGAVSFATPAFLHAASPSERLRVGLRAYQDEFYSLAAKELSAFLEAAPEDARRETVLFLLAQAQIAQSQWPEARDALLQLVGGTSEEARTASYWLGWVEHRLGNSRPALEHLLRYLQTGNDAHRHDAMLLAAGLAMEIGRFEEAAERYGHFLADAPGDPRRTIAWAGRIHALERSGAAPADTLAAVAKALADSIGDPESYRQIVTAGIRAARAAERHREEAELWAALAERPADAGQRGEALLQEGLAWLRGGATPEGRRALEAYVAGEPAGPEAVTAYSQLADLARQRGDWRAALTHLEAALSVPVTKEAAALRKGALTAALNAGEEERAARHAAALLESEAGLTSEERGTVHDVLARHRLSADPDAAVRHWLAVPDQSPRYRQSRLSAGTVLLERGRAEAAREAVAPLLRSGTPDRDALQIALAAADAGQRWGQAAQLAEELSKHPPAGQDAVAYLVRAAEYRTRQGDASGRALALRTIAERFPDHPRTPWALAELQRMAFDRGDWEDSLAWFDRLAAAGGASVTSAARYLRAETLSQLKRYETAKAEYRDLAAEGGELAGRALARLGTLLDQEGEWEEARSSYERALAAGVPDAVAEWIRKRLSAVPEAGADSEP